MKILLAVDGSRYSEAAVDEVATRPWPLGSEVKIVSAYSAYPAPAPELWGIPSESAYDQMYYNDMIMKAAREAAEGVVGEAHTRMAAHAGITVTSEAIEGPPASVILDKADDWGADLIVLGSHGYGAMKRLLLGSVSHTVAMHALCSVETVRLRASA